MCLSAKLVPRGCVLYGAPRVDVTSNILDAHLPRMCRAFRNAQRETLIETMQTVAAERKHELAISLRDDKYELERLCMQVMTLSRKLEGDREILNMFSKAPDFIKAKATRTFVEMMKLVPSCYSHINVDDKSVLATTYPITLEHDGGSYNFEPFTVEVDLNKGKVYDQRWNRSERLLFTRMSSDDPSNICWGNIGHLVSRLAGELDLHGLLQLVHQVSEQLQQQRSISEDREVGSDFVDDKMTMNRTVHGATTMATIFQTANHVGGASTVSNTMITTTTAALIDRKKKRRKPMQNLQRTPRQPVDAGVKIQVDAKALQKLWLWTDFAKGEVSCLGIVDEVVSTEHWKDYFVSRNRLLLGQAECTYDETDMDVADVASLIAELEAKGIDSRKLRCWAHSHGSMSVFWSGQDESCISGLANNEWLLSLVVNKRRDTQMRLGFTIRAHLYLADVVGCKVSNRRWSCRDLSV
jgi:hypothetical protein